MSTKAKSDCRFQHTAYHGYAAGPDLYALRGAFINMPLTLPSGECVRFWNDNKIYLGNQLPKGNTDRCYGIAADETHLMVCEYGEQGTNAELILFKHWA